MQSVVTLLVLVYICGLGCVSGFNVWRRNYWSDEDFGRNIRNGYGNVHVPFMLETEVPYRGGASNYYDNLNDEYNSQPAAPPADIAHPWEHYPGSEGYNALGSVSKRASLSELLAKLGALDEGSRLRPMRFGTGRR